MSADRINRELEVWRRVREAQKERASNAKR